MLLGSRLWVSQNTNGENGFCVRKKQEKRRLRWWVCCSWHARCMATGSIKASGELDV